MFTSSTVLVSGQDSSYANLGPNIGPFLIWKLSKSSQNDNLYFLSPVWRKFRENQTIKVCYLQMFKDTS